jgi:hypothetical protein
VKQGDWLMQLGEDSWMGVVMNGHKPADSRGA